MSDATEPESVVDEIIRVAAEEAEIRELRGLRDWLHSIFGYDVVSVPVFADEPKVDIPESTKRAWQVIHHLPQAERAFIFAWFCRCGYYLAPGGPGCAECNDD